MHVHYFTSAKYALEALKLQRYKLSIFSDLNDPFELYSADFSDLKLRQHFRRVKNLISRDQALLCCSKSWHSTLLWSHYADRHRGVALVLDVDDSLVAPVSYRKSRIPITRRDLDAELLAPNIGEGIGAKLLRIKSSDWAYEQEVRIFHDLSKAQKEGDLYFWRFNPGVKLIGLILGPLCQLEIRTVREAVPVGEEIKVEKARLAFRSFRVVSDLSFTPIRVKSVA